MTTAATKTPAAARGAKWFSSVFALAIAAFFLAFLVFPLWHVLVGAFTVDGRPSLAGFRLALANPIFIESLRNSFLVAIATTLLSTVIAVPLASAFHRFAFPFKGAIQLALLAALVLPPIVGAVGFRQVFARFGSLNLLGLHLGILDEPIDFLGAQPLLGVILVGTLHLYPILFLNLQAALGSVDPTLFEAAEAAGASKWQRTMKIALPLVLPGYFAGAVVVFIFALTDLGSPMVFGARSLISMQIYERATEGNRDSTGYALVVIVALATILLFVLSRRVVARSSPSIAAKGVVAARTRQLRGTARVGMLLGLGLLVFLTLLPHLSVLVLSLSKSWFHEVLPSEWTLAHYARVATDQIAFLGVRNSLVYASCSTVIDLVLGAMLAWLVVRRGGVVASILDTCAMLPLALPGIVLAFGYVYAFSGTALDSLRNPAVVLILGYAVRRLPYLVRSADAGFRQMPIALEEAAAGLGARSLGIWRRITLPLLTGHLLAGGILAFSFALLEVSESLILAPTKESFPIAKAIYTLAGDLADGPQVASALGILGSLILLYSLFVAGKLLGKNMGELFRA